MALVLCTGVDPAVVKTRQLLLQKAGHTVVTSMDESSFVAACQEHTFAVAVIGQAISPKQKRRLLSLVRQHCRSAQVLELYPASTGRILEEADSWLEVPAEGPQELAERVAALATKATDQSK